MRQIILDTETTGLSPDEGHRLIEIGCVELVNRRVTDSHFHRYINPEREVDEGAFKVHGISTDFLLDKPLFKDVWPDLLAFIDGAEVIIHNAPFDLSFLNAELRHMHHPKSFEQYSRIVDTLPLARKKHPGLRNNLDALCKRYNIDNSNRTLHGALLDAEILAWVYLAMTGGQVELFTEEGGATTQETTHQNAQRLTSQSAVVFATEAELAAHEVFVSFIEKKSGVRLWKPSHDREGVE